MGPTQVKIGSTRALKPLTDGLSGLTRRTYRGLIWPQRVQFLRITQRYRMEKSTSPDRLIFYAPILGQYSYPFGPKSLGFAVKISFVLQNNPIYWVICNYSI